MRHWNDGERERERSLGEGTGARERKGERGCNVTGGLESPTLQFSGSLREHQALAPIDTSANSLTSDTYRLVSLTSNITNQPCNG